MCGPSSHSSRWKIRTATSPMDVDRESGSSQSRTKNRRSEVAADGVTRVWLMLERLDANEAGKSWQQTAPRKNLFRLFERQSDDVRQRAGIARDDQLAVLLNRVAARLVESVHLR